MCIINSQVFHRSVGKSIDQIIQENTGKKLNIHPAGRISNSYINGSETAYNVCCNIIQGVSMTSLFLKWFQLQGNPTYIETY